MPLPAGAAFAGFTIVRLVGTGGMGEVYLAKHPRLKRYDALKILPAQLSDDPDYRRRFEREADLAASLFHPHVVGVHDRGEYKGQLWISMDYVDGTDAATALLQRYPAGMPREEAAHIVAGIAEALDFAHGRGLLHRDVKPANILLANQTIGRRRILLADFGIARGIHEVTRLTATNMAIGTVSYAAPEQLSGEPLDGRADQYALAATAYHLLTGKPPFQHSNPAVVISKHLNAAPPPISTVRANLTDLNSVFEIALAKSPAARFPTCDAFAAALAGIPRSAPFVVAPMPATLRAPVQVAPPPPKTVLNQRSHGRSTILAVIGAALLLAIAIFGGIQLSKRPSVAPTARPAPVQLTTPTALPTEPNEQTPTRPPLTTPTTTRMLLPDADSLGFLSYGGAARCNSAEHAVFVLRTDYSAVVICNSPTGQLSYRGLRLSDGATLILDDVYSTAEGFVASNTSENARYEVSHAGLRIIQDGQVLATEPAAESAP